MAARTCGGAGDQPATVRKGPWTLEEDLILASYISQHGEGSWDNLARAAGLSRNGKSCRLRWLNYLRPGVRRGSITPEEDAVIRELHARPGNKWSRIAKHLPGRTDNEIKNYWRTRIQLWKPTITTTTQQQPTNRAAITAAAAAAGMAAATSEGASSSLSPSASDGQQGSNNSSDAGEWCMQMQSSHDQHHHQEACDCWYMQPNPSQQESYCFQDAMAASSSSLASQDISSAAAGDGYMPRQTMSYPYCSEELGSVVDHVRMDALTTAQLFSPDITDSFWNAVDNFWEI